MGDMSFFGGWKTESTRRTSNSLGSITASSTVNVKGSWSGAIWNAAPNDTGFDSAWVMIALKPTTNAARYLLDLTVAAALAEPSNPNIENMHADRGDPASAQTTFNYLFPLRFKIDSTLRMRAQASVASAVCQVGAWIFAGGLVIPTGFDRVTTYGAATSDSGGTQIDPGVTTNTKGAWAQLVASSTNPMRGIVFCVAHNANTAPSTASWMIDLGVGASGAEKVIIADHRVTLRGAVDEYVAPSVHGPYPVLIPSGTRLAARCQSTTATSPNRLLDIIVYGID